MPDDIAGVCTGDYINNFNYNFEGVSNLAFTPTTVLPMGLTPSYTYLTTPTVEVTVTGTSTAANERVTIVIVEDDGSSRTYDYLTSGVESATDIAAGIASLINDPSVTVSNTGAVITFTANDNDYVFYVQVYDTYDDNNVRSSDPDDTNINLSVTDYVPVRGTLSMTGTITAIVTQKLTMY